MSAGDNERRFKDLVVNKFGSNALGGKRSYSSVFDGYVEQVSISVDETIFLQNGTSILIEVDSGNYAKLLVGQYVLLNGMYSGNHDGTLFLVVHCYKSTVKGEVKEYSPVRTMKNLNAIQKLNPQMVWMPHAAITLSQFESIVSMSDSVEELSASLWAVAGRQMLSLPVK